MDELWKNVIVSREHMNAEYLRKVVSFPPLQAGLALGIGCSSVLFAHSFFLYSKCIYPARKLLSERKKASIHTYSPFLDRCIAKKAVTMRPDGLCLASLS